MRKTLKWVSRASLLLLPSYLLAAEGPTGTTVIVADTRNLTGLLAWWGDLYNESHLYFALFTVLLIPLAGATLGILADFAMARTGIDLKSRALREG